MKVHAHQVRFDARWSRCRSATIIWMIWRHSLSSVGHHVSIAYDGKSGSSNKMFHRILPVFWEMRASTFP
jgi:hypothetical protein